MLSYRCPTDPSDTDRASSGNPVDNVNISHCLIHGELTHISRVRSGFHQDYICLDCGKSLVARKGEIKAHHFAHRSTTESLHCKYNETSVFKHVESLAHKTAKRIVAEEMRSLQVPAIQRQLSEEDAFGQWIILNETSTRDGGPFWVHYTSGRQEVHYGTVVPDVVVETTSKPLAVEIAVSHYCDEEKAKKLEDIDLPTVEIDLKNVLLSMRSEYGVYFECFQFDEKFHDGIANGIKDVQNIQWINISRAKREKMDQSLRARMDKEKAKIQDEYDREKRLQDAKIAAKKQKDERLKAFLDFVQEKRLNQVSTNHDIAKKYLEGFYKSHNLSETELIANFRLYAVDMDEPELGDFAFSCESSLWKLVILAIIFEKRWKVYTIQMLDSELRRYIVVKKLHGWQDVAHEENRHYWKSVSSFLRKFSQFDVEQKLWRSYFHSGDTAIYEVASSDASDLNDHKKYAAQIEKESFDNYRRSIEAQILEKLIFDRFVLLELWRVAATTNAFDYQYCEGEISESEIYISERFVYFSATLVFYGKHDYESPFSGSKIRIDISGSAQLDDDNPFIVENDIIDSDTHICAQVIDFEDDEDDESVS